MIFKKFLLPLATVLTGIAVTATNADAAYFSPLTGYTQQDLNKAIQNGSFVEDFNVSSYIGDDGIASYELELKDIVPPDNVESLVSEQFLWENNQEVDFELSFDGTTLSYTVGDKILQSVDVADGGFDINGMLLSANSTANSSATLSNLMFDDGSMSMEDLISDGGNIDFLKITGLDNNFRLSGTQTFAWNGERPSNFELAYQIRVGSFNDPVVASNLGLEVPEPRTISLLSLGAIALSIKRRR
jgi:hypothetical protein